MIHKKGPIVIIEDDPEDQTLYIEVFEKLDYTNEIVFFSNGEEALIYLQTSTVLPFLILCDINMPKMSGLELRKKLDDDADLAIRCIPFVFFSNTLNPDIILDAYHLSVQGFYKKPNTFAELEKRISGIMEYWLICVAPNNYKS